MNIKDYFSMILGTGKEDWIVISCWGSGSGPSYLNQVSIWRNGNNKLSNIEVESHPMVASLRADLSISLAWGLISNADFKENWANQFADPHANSFIIDFFYSGVLVFRDIGVSVDGGRCRLPLPDREFNEKTYEIIRTTVPRDKYVFFKLLNSLEDVNNDYEDYLSRTSSVVINKQWVE